MNELVAAVSELRDVKPAEIAAILKRRKIRGRPGTTGRCPLAMLMTGAHGGRFIVGQKYIMRQVGKNVEKVATPPNLAAFVRMFDSGKFPELFAVPPRCVPSRSGKGQPRSGPSGKHHKYKRGAERLSLAKDVVRFKRQDASAA